MNSSKLGQRLYSTSSGGAGRSVVIVSAKRTAIGAFMGQFKTLNAPQLGTAAVRGVLDSAGVPANEVDESFFGCVLQAGLGQAPDRQVILGAGCSVDTPSTCVNKVCASGMKAVMLAAQQIKSGDRDVVLAGGMENMSKIPHYLSLRQPHGYGPVKSIDAIVHDGLTDVYNNLLMGSCTEKIISEMGISRAAQDEFAVYSYQRARAAQETGQFKNEIQNMSFMGPNGKELVIDEDEECKKFFPNKFPQLRPAFGPSGTITAANASKLNDGAAALLLMGEDAARARGLQPLARIIGFEDAGVEPVDFAIAPAKACDKLLKKTGLQMGDIEYHEINEAFAAVALANMKLMNLDPAIVNVNGGAVALGHPIGMSGARILISLMTVLRNNNATLGMASICNGGGGASAVILERMN